MNGHRIPICGYPPCNGKYNFCMRDVSCYMRALYLAKTFFLCMFHVSLHSGYMLAWVFFWSSRRQMVLTKDPSSCEIASLHNVKFFYVNFFYPSYSRFLNMHIYGYRILFPLIRLIHSWWQSFIKQPPLYRPSDLVFQEDIYLCLVEDCKSNGY